LHAEPPKLFWKANDRGTVLSIHLTPRSSRSQVIGNVDGWLKVKVTAPPTDDEANDALLKFLAKRLRVAPSKLAIIKGHKSRNKAVLVSDATTRNSCSANGSLRSPVRYLATSQLPRLPSDQPHHRGVTGGHVRRNIAALSALVLVSGSASSAPHSALAPSLPSALLRAIRGDAGAR
jgi:hypothetical protein